MRGRPTESEDGVGKRSTWRSCQLHLELTWRSCQLNLELTWSFQLNLELTWSSSQLNRLSSRWRILDAGEGEEAIKGMRGRPTESEDGVGKRSTWRSCQLHLELTWRSCQLNLELTWSFQLNLELTWSSSQLNRLSSRWRILACSAALLSEEQ